MVSFCSFPKKQQLPLHHGSSPRIQSLHILEWMVPATHTSARHHTRSKTVVFHLRFVQLVALANDSNKSFSKLIGWELYDLGLDGPCCDDGACVALTSSINPRLAFISL